MLVDQSRISDHGADGGWDVDDGDTGVEDEDEGQTLNQRIVDDEEILI